MQFRTSVTWLFFASIIVRCAVAAEAPAPASIPGITLPSEHNVNLRFPVSGVVEKVLVKPGDRVKAGDPMVVLDSRLEQKELEILKMDESELQIEAAKKERDAKKVEFERLDDLRKRNVATAFEWEKAKVEYEISELRIRKAEQDRQQARLKREKQELLISMMTMLAKTDAVVEKVELHPGETVDREKPVLTLVRNQPLWVEVHMPADQAQALETMQKRLAADGRPLEMKVRYAEGADAGRRSAKVIYFAPKADARSATRLVRLEWENPDGTGSGLRVMVDLPDELAAKPAK